MTDHRGQMLEQRRDSLKGLYIHIPFCEAICTYCDFTKRIPKNREMVDDYIDELIRELGSYRDHFASIDTVYIGGGTPSMLSVEQMDRLFRVLEPIEPVEYTIEVNPESYTFEKGERFKAFGINRVSLGVQTFDPVLLSTLNRKHRPEDVDAAIRHLNGIGIERISLDMIYAIPGQTLDSLEKDLDGLKRLDVPHVSYYSLILEEKTVLYDRYRKGEIALVENDLEARMYERVIAFLTARGYEHYEISNFAKPGMQSVHNTLYWTHSEYIGCGLGAHGYLDGTRYQNATRLSDYRRPWIKEAHETTMDERLSDELIFGLRRLEGVDLERIERDYGIDPFRRYPELKSVVKEGLVEVCDGRLRLTKKGLFYGNQVFMVFI
ncbi:MAG: radical SAM family heme chaperone HemW [Acholeplasmataceae bacterium]